MRRILYEKNSFHWLFLCHTAAVQLIPALFNFFHQQLCSPDRFLQRPFSMISVNDQLPKIYFKIMDIQMDARFGKDSFSTAEF